MEEALADPDLRQYPYLYHLLKYPKKNPILFDFMLNKLDGPYYRERSVSERLDKIKVPTYVGGPLFSFFSQPQINVFNRSNVPKKMFLYTDMGTRPWRAHHDELLRWYDYWLKGIETGIMDEAPVRYHTTVAEKWQSGAGVAAGEHRVDRLLPQQPGAAAARARLLQRRAGRLRAGAALRDREDGRGSPTSAAPLSEDLQVTGPPRVTFYASIDTADTNWRVDVREEGSDAIYPLASGWLKASHRTLDHAQDHPLGDRPRPHQGRAGQAG